MIRFTEDQIKLIYQLLIQETGGSFGIRDENLLDSAINGIYQTFDGKELYPTKEEKGARLGYSLVANHAFLDGNKRIGVHVMLTFLEMNGIHLKCTDDELVVLGLGLASGEINYETLLEWVHEHKQSAVSRT